MHSSRIPAATDLRILKANGAIECAVPRGSLWAIFDAEYVPAGTDPEVEGVFPALTCRTSDFLGLQIIKDDPITVGEETFRFARHEPDGTGFSILVLYK